MSVKIKELMRDQVIFLTEKQPIEHIRKIFEKNKISALPVVDVEERLLGIISHKDLLGQLDHTKTAKDLMTQGVYTIPEYENVETAARIMRNHKIHHLVVTHEKKLVGIISSFDLLKLIEGNKYVAKSSQKQSAKATGKRNKVEMAGAI